MIGVNPIEIRKARKRAGLTQAELATLLGYSVRAVSEWENGRRNMRPLVYDAMIDKLTRKGEK